MSRDATAGSDAGQPKIAEGAIAQRRPNRGCAHGHRPIVTPIGLKSHANDAKRAKSSEINSRESVQRTQKKAKEEIVHHKDTKDTKNRKLHRKAAKDTKDESL